MKFEIVPNEQTPEIPAIAFSDGKLYVEHHREEFEAFLDFAREQPTAVGLAANQCTLDGERFIQGSKHRSGNMRSIT